MSFLLQKSVPICRTVSVLIKVSPISSILWQSNLRVFKVWGKGARIETHAILFFDDDTIGYVLERYAEYLTEAFSESELKDGIFTAIGAVHRPQWR